MGLEGTNSYCLQENDVYPWQWEKPCANATIHLFREEYGIDATIDEKHVGMKILMLLFVSYMDTAMNLLYYKQDKRSQIQFACHNDV